MNVKIDWRAVKTEHFSIESAREGGLGLFAIRILADAGIPARRCESVYQGHVGIEVPAKFAKRAEKLIL